VYFEGRAWAAAVYRREELPGGRRVRGPAVICEYSATTLVPPGWRLAVDRFGGLVLEDLDA
jgi:N-methylhydantoinase A